MYFRFTNEYKESKIDELVTYLSGPRLWIPKTDYPDSDLWAQKAYLELKKGKKRAMLAYDHRSLAGIIIYQRHKQITDALELKQLTVRPESKGRYVASFLLRNFEIEGKKDFKGTNHVLLDAKERNNELRKFFERHRYRVTDRLDLYGLGGGVDLVFKKNI